MSYKNYQKKIEKKKANQNKMENKTKQQEINNIY